ncbi:MAG: DUF456 domain-containing protein [Chloroflexi bacterium]|nr:DUF456 domain-containing protein [Chloroflexota bacterium]MQC26838.1 DUF456 domain-containing protein [Chloroflexota bacterium]
MPPWLSTSSAVLSLIVMLVGLFGLVIPIFPGGVVIWLAALGYGLLNGFGTTGTIIFIIITILMIASAAADNVLMGAKARDAGASWWSIIIALVAGAIVTFLVPPFGGLLAAPVALYIAELVRRRDWDQALRTTRGMLVGCGWAFVVRFGLGLLKIGLWVIWAWGDLT